MAKIVRTDYDLELEHPALDNMSDDEFFSLKLDLSILK
jgi:hypothetical protein